MRSLDEMYVANQKKEQSDRHEAVAKKPQQVREIESRKDLRIQLKEDRYQDADVRQRCKDENADKRCQPIQCDRIKTYGGVAMGRVRKIVKKRTGKESDDDLLGEVNQDVNNTIYNIPGKTQGHIFNSIFDLSSFVDNQYAAHEMGKDLNDNKNGFNEQLMDIQPFLTQALQNVLFPGGDY